MVVKCIEFLSYNKCILNLDNMDIVELYKKQEIGHDLHKKTSNMKVE